jgi:dienelactone hydrolase
MGGGYTSVIPIPVDDPGVKVIAGALFRPDGEGPFPAVVYLSGSAGIDTPLDHGLQKTLIDHLLSAGVATLIVDPFTPRNELFGISEKLDGPEAHEYFDRGARDALAAVKVLRARPDIDVHRVFLQGYSYGATSAIRAVDDKNAAARDRPIAGVVAFYPLCSGGLDPSVPVLVLIGSNDEVTPAALCREVEGKRNFEVVVYPGATHAFAVPGLIEGDFFGRHLAYDGHAARDAEARADAFMAAPTWRPSPGS